MSVPSRRPNNASKRIRTVFLMLLSILLILLLVYVALPYVPLRRGVPTSVAAVTPTETATAEPSPTETRTSKPSLTYTPVLPVSPEAKGTVAPSPTRRLPAKTPTPRPPTPSPTPTSRAKTPTVELVVSPEMEALGETAQPPASPPPSRTPAAPLPARTPIVALPSRTPAAAVSPPAPAVPPTAAPVAARVVQTGDGLLNSAFEQGFLSNGVAMAWDNFNNSSAEFSYQADTWPWVYAEPGRTQIMRIRNAGLPDRYMGIYQTADVIPGQVYTLTVTGLVRTNVGDVQQTRFGYRMQIGFDLLGGRNWKAVSDWIELPWDEQRRASERYRIDSYTTNVTAGSDRLTIFVRAWKKWADAGEGAYDVDSVNLVGPAYVAVSALPAPTTVGAAQAPPTPGDIASADIPAAQALPLPATGQPEQTLWDNIRMLITITLLVALIGGALWRVGRWRQM